MKRAIINQIKASKGIVLGAHMNPDGDAVGALIGMATLCGFFHIPYQILLEKIPEAFQELLKEMICSTEATIDYDTFISVDCGSQERLGIFEEAFLRATHTINIDHHETNTYFGELNDIKVAAASCEIVYDIIKEAACPLTPHLASSLYTGILTDTGGFMHSCTTSRTHQIVSELMQVPFDFTKVYYDQMYQESEVSIRMTAKAIDHIQKMAHFPYYLAYVTKEEMDSYGATKEDLGSIINKVKNIKGCELAVFIYPLDENQYKVSLRSNAPLDVAKVASNFGGGGHVRAAGATLKGDLTEIIDRVETALKLTLN